MELRHLRAFVAVAEELHFGRAADRLHIAQPPLSKQIKQLERQLGVTLLDRTSRHVELTHPGWVFLHRAREVLRETEWAVETAQRAARGEVGWLTVGFVDSAAYELLPRILAAHRERFPDVRLYLRELSSYRQLELLGDELDVGIVREMDAGAGVALHPLERERLVAALPLGHALAGRDEIALADLAAEPFVTFPRETVPNVYDHLVGLCRAAGFTPRTSQEALQYPTMLGLVAGEFGVALVPRSVQTFCRSAVAYVPLSDPIASSELLLAVPTGATPPALVGFVEAARQAAG